MRTVLVVGIGMGEPEGLTARAVAAMSRADVFVLLDKSEGASELVSARAALIARFGKPGHRLMRAPSPPRRAAPIPVSEPDAARGQYNAAVEDWHQARARLLAGLIGDLGADETAALLVWGDPMLYDSTLRVLAAARQHLAQSGAPDFALEVVPGITALQALCAAFSMPLNAIGEGVLLTTGRNVAQATPDASAFAVLLDDGSGLRALMSRGWAGEVWWGANLGTSAERLISGRLAEVGEDILHARAQVKAERGWVMDLWLARAAPR